MANVNTAKPATDRGHESYADDAQAQRVLPVNATGTPTDDTNPLSVGNFLWDSMCYRRIFIAACELQVTRRWQRILCCHFRLAKQAQPRQPLIYKKVVFARVKSVVRHNWLISSCSSQLSKPTDYNI